MTKRDRGNITATTVRTGRIAATMNLEWTAGIKEKDRKHRKTRSEEREERDVHMASSACNCLRSASSSSSAVRCRGLSTMLGPAG